MIGWGIGEEVKANCMKIAFSHPKDDRAAELFRGLSAKLAGQELVSWPMGEAPLGTDFRILLALGPVRRE